MTFEPNRPYDDLPRLPQGKRNHCPRTQITLNADEWGRAVAMLDTPPNPHPKMKALFDRGFINEF